MSATAGTRRESTLEYGVGDTELRADRLQKAIRHAPEFDLVVADASWTWTQRLFTPLAALGVRVLLLEICDWQNALIQRKRLPDWFSRRSLCGPNLWRQSIILPPGWMKSYPRIGMRPIAAAVRRWRAHVGPRPNLTLAISYPQYIELHRQLLPDQLIYYNMDDYGCYWPRHAQETARLERDAVSRANLTIACAIERAKALRRNVAGAADRVIHLPHGAPDQSIAVAPVHRAADAPADLSPWPKPYLGFVGSLEDRLDWRLLGDLARRFDTGTVVLIGRPPKLRSDQAWADECRQTLALPNVAALGWRSQDEIGRYVASFDVGLIPYLVEHPFNRVSSPTKLMDYMASTRPVVTTALPECALYDRWFDVAHSRAAFVDAVARIVAAGGDDGRATQRWHHARAGTWQNRAQTLWSEFFQRN